jgi:hypothetical protein
MTTTPTTHPRARRSLPIVLVLPLVLVNAAAIWGQAGWSYTHIAPASWTDVQRLTLSLLFALAVESIGVYLAWEAHQAQMANQSSGLLRLASYGVGALVGYLNYSHFAGDTLTPTPQAVTFGLLSAISPWLWAIRSRSMNRDRLAELDMTDERGLKLSTSRKFWHPFKSFSVLRAAAWWGETRPSVAVARWEAQRAGEPVAAMSFEPERREPVQAEIVIDDDSGPASVSAGQRRAAHRLSDSQAARALRALLEVEPNATNVDLAPIVTRSPRTVAAMRRELRGTAKRTTNGPHIGFGSE